MPDITFNVEGIYNLLNSLDINKAPGPDEIPSRILKHCAIEVVQVISTQSMSSGVLPNNWTRVKKGDKWNPLNYRFISLQLAICCKIMEHIVYHSIMDHLDNYNTLHNYQYGFRQGHSSETQLITVVEDILYAILHIKYPQQQ